MTSVVYTNGVPSAGDRGCPYHETAVRTCGSRELPLCEECTNVWMEALRKSSGSAMVNPLCGPITPGEPCVGFHARAIQRSFKPGEPIADETRSTLGRLFGGDIT